MLLPHLQGHSCLICKKGRSWAPFCSLVSLQTASTAAGAGGAEDFFSSTSPQGLLLEEGKEEQHPVLTEAGCTAIRIDSYFYLLPDKQTCSLFLKVSIRTQTKPSTPGEHHAQPSFPKTQAKPRTRKSDFLWDWLQLHINSSACRLCGT